MSLGFFIQYPYGGTINDWYENMSIAFGIGNGAFRWETFSVLTFLFSLNVTSSFFAFTLAKKQEKPKSFTKAFFTYTLKNIWRVIPIIGGLLLLVQVQYLVSYFGWFSNAFSAVFKFSWGF